jgi:hypothetical protein
MRTYTVEYAATVDADSPEQAAQRLRDTAAVDAGCNYLVRVADSEFGPDFVTPMTDAAPADAAAGHLLIRSEDWAGLYSLDAYTDGLARLGDHFDGAHTAGEPWGDVFYIPAEGAGAIVPVEVATSQTGYDENDYARRTITLTIPGRSSVEVSHRVDGRA